MFLSRLYHAFFQYKGKGWDLMKEPLVVRGGVVFDIGANIGRFTGFIARQVGGAGRVYSFEPVDMSARVLRAMLLLRRCWQATVVQVGLSDHSGDAEISIPLVDGWKPRLSNAFVGAQVGAARQRIELLTLDGFCTMNGIQRIDFLKCDTEGHELFVFRGGQKALQRFRPVIYCEIEKPYLDRQGIAPAEVFGLLRDIGYAGFLPDGRGHLVPVEGYRERGDYFFIHKDRMNDKIQALIER